MLKLPEHKCGLYITHNEHKNYYLSVEEYIADDISQRCDWLNEEAKAKAIATNEVWTLQWYPNTPVGFNCVAAPTLEELLDFANSYTNT